MFAVDIHTHTVYNSAVNLIFFYFAFSKVSWQINKYFSFLPNTQIRREEEMTELCVSEREMSSNVMQAKKILSHWHIKSKMDAYACVSIAEQMFSLTDVGRKHKTERMVRGLDEWWCSRFIEVRLYQLTFSTNTCSNCFDCSSSAKAFRRMLYFL